MNRANQKLDFQPLILSFSFFIGTFITVNYISGYADKADGNAVGP
jgi:hypothetical protein